MNSEGGADGCARVILLDGMVSTTLVHALGSSVVCTPTAHDRSEWKRLADDAYRLGLDATGRRFAFAAAQPAAVSFDPATF